MEWKLELHDDFVLIHTYENGEPYCWGSVHLDAFYDCKDKDWYRELIGHKKVWVEFEGTWI